jgi:hypothetical protein
MHGTIISEGGNFGSTLPVPRKLTECQSAHTWSNVNSLHARFCRHQLFATPPVDNKDFTTGSYGDIPIRIVVQPAKLNRARGTGQRVLRQRVGESVYAIIKNQ